MGPLGVAGFLFYFFRELLANLPAMLRMRRARARAGKRAGTGRPPARKPRVVCVSDNLDEVNGIALASRIQLRELRRLGYDAWLYGVAFHTQQPRREGADGALTLSAGVYSVDQAGYANSELAIPRLGDFIEFLEANDIDLIEFETPGPVSHLCLAVALVTGIPTASHYRTDIITYSETLIRFRFGVAFVQFWTRLFTRNAGPVIVPSEAYRDKVAAMGVAPARIHKLPRGVDLAAFNPSRRDENFWTARGVPADGFLLLYVGRVSAEKNLEALCDAFPRALERNPDLRLVTVGDGPWLEEMKARLLPTGRAHFTGVLHGDVLATAFASSDLFVFPSLTDTFGNSVIEALASGLPCLVSDEGGPQEIVVPGVCGEIFAGNDPDSLKKGIVALSQDPARLARYREAARRRASEFTYEAAARAFWDLYLSILKN
ncbi:MAG: glycosyl transferase family 1 [Fibrobacteria bacterium]|nr:glycosyl transferase family 1 [Fibrobacteria bacterium]